MNYTISVNQITLINQDGRPLTIYSDEQNFEKVKAAIRQSRFEEAVKLIDNEEMLSSVISHGEVKVVDGRVYVRDVEVNNEVSQALLDIISEEMDYQPVIRFMDKLASAGSLTLMKELFLFIEAGKLMLTPDGDFLAYKAVTKDFLDFRTRRFDNSPGSEVTEDRLLVDDNRKNTCSKGLHFSSYEYARRFAEWQRPLDSKIILVKVNPVDVVSIPYDYENQKGRCCRYIVVKEVFNSSELDSGRVYDFSEEESGDKDKSMMNKPIKQKSSKSISDNKSIDYKRMIAQCDFGDMSVLHLSIKKSEFELLEKGLFDQITLEASDYWINKIMLNGDHDCVLLSKGVVKRTDVDKKALVRIESTSFDEKIVIKLSTPLYLPGMGADQ